MTGAAKRLLGAWSLVSLERYRNEVFHRCTMGDGATGRLIYEGSGVMCAFLASAAWARGEVAQDWTTFLAYSGRWSMPDAQTVVHRLDTASIAAMIGMPLTRYVSWLPDERIMLTTAAHINREGQRSRDQLVWRREQNG